MAHGHFGSVILLTFYKPHSNASRSLQTTLTTTHAFGAQFNLKELAGEVKNARLKLQK